MESKNQLKEIGIKNRTYYYLDDTIKVEDIDFDNILLYKQSYLNVLIYDISYETFMCAKSLSIRFNEVYGTTKIYDETRYLELFGSCSYNVIFNRINYLVSEKSDVKYIIKHNFAKIRIFSYNSLLIEKTLTFHNVIIFIKSVLNKNKNNYYHNIF